MKYRVFYTTRCKKSVKKMLRRGKSEDKFYAVVDMLAKGETLPPQYHDHPLFGDRIGYRDCHIESDWVLIYTIKNDMLILTLTDTGTHSDLVL